MKFLRIILFPLVPIYGAVIAVRNLFFDKNILKSKKVDAKVISIGNITVGGSGKTPMVIYLTKFLKNNHKSVGVLSRGYGRKSKGYLLVSDGKNILTGVDQSGDEIYQTALECKVPAAVSEKRYSGALRFLAEAKIDTLILDDAYQHRWIERDINILIFEQRFLNNTSILNQSLLPAGNLREPFAAIERADIIILNRKFSAKTEIPEAVKKHFDNKKIFTSYYKAVGFSEIGRDIDYKLSDFKGQKSLIVSGIANPFSFINVLNQVNVDTKNKLIFKDHKNYSQKEIQNIRKKFYSTNSHSVITTEKDAVKLINFSNDLDDIDIFYLKIELHIDDEKPFNNLIISKLNY